MSESERWVEIWKGADPAPPGRALQAAGIEMRLASDGWCSSGGVLGIFSFFRRQGGGKILVRESDRERARAALK